MPALGPAAWWFGELLTQENLHWPPWLSGKTFPPRLRNKIVAIVVGIACIALLVYGLIAVRFCANTKRFANTRGKSMPSFPERSALRCQSQVPAVFVLCPRAIRYVSTIEQLPADTKFFLVQARMKQKQRRQSIGRPAGPSWSYASLIIASTRRLFFLFHPRADPG
jgi:hypothetical protein